MSRGYQQNFASLPEKRVAVVDVRRARVVDPSRPIKSNFRERGFTTFLEESGVPNALLEKAFASVEARVLNEIRMVSAHRRGAQQKADVANLFAIHLVRSPSFKTFHAHIGEQFRESDVPITAEDPSLPERFELSEGRQPDEGELLELAKRSYDALVSDPMHLVTTMIRQHDAMAEMLNRFHLQVVEVPDHLPGLVVGDTPVVHASASSSQYGFRDRLALGDANLIVGPLTRRTAACFTVKPLPPAVLRTRKKVDALNAVFLRAAIAEVACHPDDAVHVQQVCRRLDRLPTEILLGP